MNNTKHNKRKNTLEGAKILLVSISITAMIFFWAKFSRDDQIANLANGNSVAAVQEPFVINLSSIPTLVPFEWEEEEEGERPSNQNQPLELRSVTAPSLSVSSNNGPVIIVGGKGGGGSPSTSTGSS
jgi:hypothetical protein